MNSPTKGQPEARARTVRCVKGAVLLVYLVDYSHFVIWLGSYVKQLYVELA